MKRRDFIAAASSFPILGAFPIQESEAFQENTVEDPNYGKLIGFKFEYGKAEETDEWLGPDGTYCRYLSFPVEDLLIMTYLGYMEYDNGTKEPVLTDVYYKVFNWSLPPQPKAFDEVEFHNTPFATDRYIDNGFGSPYSKIYKGYRFVMSCVGVHGQEDGRLCTLNAA